MNDEIRKILVADDDAEDLMFLREGLEQVFPFAEIVEVADGVDCLRHLKTHEQRPDLVFLDLNMPIKGGLQALKDIYNEELIIGTPVIIYSTSHNIRDIDAAYKYGAALYLVKPWSSNTLISLLQTSKKMLLQGNGQQRPKTEFVVWQEKAEHGY